MKQLIILYIFLLCIGNIFAQGANQSEIERRVDSLVNQSLNHDTPGGVIAVVSHNKVLLKKAYGLMNLDYKLPNSETTVFILASVSKHFTAFAVLLLEKEGKLKLDDEIHKYLSDLPDFGQPITIRQLLHHVSGLPSTDVLRLLAGLQLESPWDSKDEIDLISRYAKLNCKPNEEHIYANPNYFLLAKIVEKVSNNTYAGFMEENIFKPLGMNNSAVNDKSGKTITNRASGYRKDGESYIKLNTEGEAVYGSTNIYISANDAVKWLQNLLAPKSEFKDIVNRFYNPCDKFNNGDTIKYTFGMNVWNYRGVKIAQHGGSTLGFHAEIMVFPEYDAALLVMFNNESFDTYNLAKSLADLYLAGKLKPDTKQERKEISVSKEILRKYAGNYLMPDGMELPFKLENDTLWLVIPSAPKFQMHAESDKEFFIKEFDAQCSFQKGSNDECNEIIWHQNSQNPKGIRVIEHKELSDTEKKIYTGRYFSSILDIAYSVNLENNQLILLIPKAFSKTLGFDRNVKLQYLNSDKFYTGNLGIVEFTRDDNKAITGFRFVDLGRVRNVEFQKAN